MYYPYYVSYLQLNQINRSVRAVIDPTVPGPRRAISDYLWTKGPIGVQMESTGNVSFAVSVRHRNSTEEKTIFGGVLPFFRKEDGKYHHAFHQILKIDSLLQEGEPAWNLGVRIHIACLPNQTPGKVCSADANIFDLAQR